jgi:ribosome-binding factor A
VAAEPAAGEPAQPFEPERKMSIDRLTRVNEQLRKEIAEALFHVMNEPGFDLSAVTVTHVITSADLRHARVLISIRDHVQDKKHMLYLIQHHRKTIQQMVSKRVILKYTPQFIFELDSSLEQGDRVLQLIAEMESKGSDEAPVNPEAKEPEDKT